MYLVDSNVFLNVLLYGDKFATAKKFLNEYDFIRAYQLQKKYILTSNDALILSIAGKENAILITYDKELLKYDGIICSIKTIESSQYGYI